MRREPGWCAQQQGATAGLREDWGEWAARRTAGGWRATGWQPKLGVLCPALKGSDVKGLRGLLVATGGNAHGAVGQPL